MSPPPPILLLMCKGPPTCSSAGCDCRGSSAEVYDSWFVGNSALNSGAGAVFDSTNSSVSGSVFKDNKAQVSHLAMFHLLCSLMHLHGSMCGSIQSGQYSCCCCCCS